MTDFDDSFESSLTGGLYEGDGIRFRYPEIWNLAEDRRHAELTITVAADETAFWSITLLYDRPGAKQVLKQAVEVFREEYDELDEHPLKIEIAHQAAEGADLEFVCWDLLNSAFLRVFRTGRFTVVLLAQTVDTELEQVLPVFEAITASLECDLDGQILIH